MIEIRRVGRSLGGQRVLEDVDLIVPEATVTCVIGPSGSGKSTLLRCVNRLERIDRGWIAVGGELIGYRWHRGRLRELGAAAVARQRARIGMVFQEFHLFPHFSVLDNVVEAPMAVLGMDRPAAVARARDLLAKVGLSEKETASPGTLSGGEKQRVAIARALAMSPKVMLFDEPTSALDPERSGEVLKVIRDLADDGMTMLVVTHELRFAREIADEIVFMDAGRIVESGPPANLLDRPRQARTAEFVSHALG
jgi:polar amino acid transport system ATP-binding protein